MTETLGRFLSNVIEFVIAGIIFGGTLIFGFSWFFPDAARQVRAELTTIAPGSESLVFTIGIAASYAFGILAENVSRQVMEWRLDQTKNRRAKRKKLTKSYGDMRFAVMARVPDLYLEIESQLKRLRVERVVAFSLILLAPVLATAMIEAPSLPRAWLLAVYSVALIISLVQVDSRFNRYCRAIERSYMECDSTRNDGKAEDDALTD